MKALLISLLYILGCQMALAGTRHNPATIVVTPGENIQDAVRQAREWRRVNDPRCTDGIRIVLKAGRYYMHEPLFLRPEDSGSQHSLLTICSEEGAVVCGDPKQQHTQVWPVNSQGEDATQVIMERMIDFNTVDRTVTIPTPAKHVLKMKGLEMVVHQRWAMAILRVKEMKAEGDRTVVSFMEPESRLEFEHPWPQPVIGGERGNSSFLLRTTEQRDGIEQLVVADGACNVVFEGITFEYTCWNRPLHQGHVTLQGGFPLMDAYKLAVPGLPWDADLENQAWVERPVSAVTVRNVGNVCFRNCTFRHLGATALDFQDNVNDCAVTNCLFEDIGGTAILGGSFAESPREVHRPYSDLAARCDALHIVDNTIRSATVEDWGAVAIGLGYVRNSTIERNDISHVNYSGICVGWGWTPYYTGMEHNRIVNNKVCDYARQLYDAGAIYTLSHQPASVIRDNDISRPFPAPYATNDRGFRIYLDARTDGYTIEGNTTEGRPIRRDEIGDNHPGPTVVFK